MEKNKISIVYYSFTGNVYRMLNSFLKGLEEENEKEFKVYKVAEVKDEDASEIFSSEIIVLASPANAAEEIEKQYFQPFVEKNLEKFRNKKIFLFGSYGWGGGKYLKDFSEKLKKVGAEVDEDIISCQGNPNSEIKEKLYELGKKLSKM